MPSRNTKKLELNQYQKSDKATFIIYADLEYLIKKIDGCNDNPELIPSAFSMSTISSLKCIEDKHDV